MLSMTCWLRIHQLASVAPGLVQQIILGDRPVAGRIEPRAHRRTLSHAVDDSDHESNHKCDGADYRPYGHALRSDVTHHPENFRPLPSRRKALRRPKL